MSHPSGPTVKRHAFTLVELLVSIAILALLIGLVVKGVSKFRKAAWATDTQNELMTIANAIQEYYSTFHAYPGPIHNNVLSSSDTPIAPGFNTATAATGYDTTNPAVVTGSENLVLGLYGGLRYDTATSKVVYDPSYVGQGPMSLNSFSPKKYTAFMSDAKLLSWRDDTAGKTGHYKDDAAAANDSVIPELVDRFPQGMPILFLRASAGAQSTGTTAADNGVITYQSATRGGQYQLEQIAAYTRTNIGEQRQLAAGRSYVPTSPSYAHGLSSVNFSASLDKSNSGYQYPFDAFPYLLNSTLSSTTSTPPVEVARKKDEYILVSPGPDRIYGTEDDITNFGSVLP